MTILRYCFLQAISRSQILIRRFGLLPCTDTNISPSHAVLHYREMTILRYFFQDDIAITTLTSWVGLLQLTLIFHPRMCSFALSWDSYYSYNIAILFFRLYRDIVFQATLRCWFSGDIAIYCFSGDIPILFFQANSDIVFPATSHYAWKVVEAHHNHKLQSASFQ